MKGFPSRASGARWIKFNMVGAMGIGVQIALLAVLTGILRLDYLPATAAAVELTVVHNFLWHEGFTWADRSPRRSAGRPARFLRFQMTVGLVSVGGNLLLMRFLVRQAHAPILFADLLSVAVCSVLNFVINDTWVFRPQGSF